jgi:hypothetical protein
MTRRELRIRNCKILELRRSGLKFTEIARRARLTAQMVSKICVNTEREAEQNRGRIYPRAHLAQPFEQQELYVGGRWYHFSAAPWERMKYGRVAPRRARKIP